MVDKQKIVDLLIRWLVIGITTTDYDEGKVAARVLSRLMENEKNLLDIDDAAGVKILTDMVAQEVEMLKL